MTIFILSMPQRQKTNSMCSIRAQIELWNNCPRTIFHSYVKKGKKDKTVSHPLNHGGPETGTWNAAISVPILKHFQLSFYTGQHHWDRCDKESTVRYAVCPTQIAIYYFFFSDYLCHYRVSFIRDCCSVPS